MLSPLTLLALGALLMVLLMGGLWLVQRRTRDAGIVDVGWAAGLGLLALLYGVAAPGHPTRRYLVAILAALWSFRLARHLLVDRVLGKPEDGRYQTLRAGWGNQAQRNFFIFFQAQALLDVVFSLPFLAVALSPLAAPRALDGLAIAVWLIAVTGEFVADRQLARFRRDPANRGRTCRTGLWRLSRHPNYFFEWLHWWTYVLLAAGSPWAPLTLLGPALMLLFLFKLTGIPHTEAQALKSRGDDYRAYQRTTSVFIPWFPRKESA